MQPSYPVKDSPNPEPDFSEQLLELPAHESHRLLVLFLSEHMHQGKCSVIQYASRSHLAIRN